MKLTLTKQCKKELELLNKNQPKHAKLVALKMKELANWNVSHVKLA